MIIALHSLLSHISKLLKVLFSILNTVYHWKIEAFLDYSLMIITTRRGEEKSGNLENCNEVLIFPKEGG